MKIEISFKSIDYTLFQLISALKLMMAVYQMN